MQLKNFLSLLPALTDSRTQKFCNASISFHSSRQCSSWYNFHKSFMGFLWILLRLQSVRQKHSQILSQKAIVYLGLFIRLLWERTVKSLEDLLFNGENLWGPGLESLKGPLSVWGTILEHCKVWSKVFGHMLGCIFKPCFPNSTLDLNSAQRPFIHEFFTNICHLEKLEMKKSFISQTISLCYFIIKSNSLAFLSLSTFYKTIQTTTWILHPETFLCRTFSSSCVFPSFQVAESNSVAKLSPPHNKGPPPLKFPVTFFFFAVIQGHITACYRAIKFPLITSLRALYLLLTLLFQLPPKATTCNLGFWLQQPHLF